MGTLRLWKFGAFGALGCLMTASAGAFTLACSGSTSPLLGTPDAALDGTDQGDAAASDGGTSYTLDNVCTLVPPKLCAFRKSCCDQTGGYNEANCLAYEKAECEKNVAEARGGTISFQPSIIDSCLATLEPVLKTTCLADISQYDDLADKLNQCHVFSGKLGEGMACDRTAQCTPSTGTGSFTSCDDDTKKCSTITFLPAGSNCAYRDGSRGICAAGTYCDVPLDGGALEGTCKTALAPGAPCQLARPFDCGLTYFCDPGTKTCTKGQAGGAPCANDLQCISLKCDKPDAGGLGTCRAQEPVPKAQECGRL